MSPRIPLAVAVVVALLTSAVQAQSTSLFGSSSPIGQTGLGSGSSLGNSSSRRATGGLGGGGGAPGGLGLGSGTGSSLNIGGNSQFGPGSAGLSTSGMVGNSTANGFIGNTRAGVTGQAGRAGQTGRAGQGGSITQGSNPFADLLRGGLGGQQGQQATEPKGKLRPQLRVGFNVTPRPAANVDKSLTGIFTRTPNTTSNRLVQTRLFTNVTIVPPVNGTLILRGTVATEDDVKLAGFIARMEPGVRTVQNELQVRADAQPELKVPSP